MTRIKRFWPVISILTVVVLLLIAARVVLTTHNARRPADALDVTVVGHQFWWEYRYPRLGFVTANELHIPVSDAQHLAPTYLTLTSADIAHSFSVPRLAGKTNLLPNRMSTMILGTAKPGLYLGQCTQHAKMLLRIYVQSPADFAAWVAHQQQPAVDDPSVAPGRAIFLHTACISCHTVRGTVAAGTFGPDLTHLASRDTIAAGTVPLTQPNLHAFVDNPATFKPGALMPPMHLSTHDLDLVTAYLLTLK